MACNLIPLTAGDVCESSDGGIVRTQIADCDDIADVILDANGKVTGFVMAVVNAWVDYTMDDDDTAYFNQTGERTNKKHTVTQTGFFKFAGVTQTSLDFANGIKSCCCLVAIHEFTTGIRLVQGIDVDATAGTWQKSKKNVKAIVSVFSDTGDNEARTEVTLESTGRCFTACTSLSADTINLY